MDFKDRSINVRAFALPKIQTPEGKTWIPVVTAMNQGRSAAGLDDDQLVPAGAGAQAMAVNGSAGRDNADFWKGQVKEPNPEAKVFPQRLILLVDNSPSMEGANLNLVKEKISDLKPVLDEKHIETIVIPYNSDVGALTVHHDAKSVIERIQGLTTAGGTDIYRAIDYAQRALFPGEDKRTTVLLISDGKHLSFRHKSKDIREIAKKYPDANLGIYTVGVGAGYDENLMRGILEAVGFGGAVHIPEAKGSQQVFQTLLPDFIRGVSSAPHFPIFKFNQWFDKVINLTPTMRPVHKQDGNYPAVAGYQNDSYTVGFVEEQNLDHAEIHAEVKHKASDKKPFEDWNLEIENLDDALGLDSSERELIKTMPWKALQVELLKARDAEALRKFVEANPDWDGEIKGSFDSAAASIDQLEPGDDLSEGDFRAEVSFADSIIGSASVSQGRPARSEINDRTLVGADTHGDTVITSMNGVQSGAIAQKTYKISVTGVGIKIKSADPKNPLHLVIQEGDTKNPVHLVMQEGVTKKIGRRPDNDIQIFGDLASKDHAELKFENGLLYIKDARSKNGTYVNDERISNVDRKISLGDTVRVGATTLKFEDGV